MGEDTILVWSAKFFVETLLKLGLSVVCSTIISIERELHTHPGGVATHVLVGLASCLFTMISVYMRERYPAANADPARICAQVVNGMGFLGSATVYKSNNYVKGINTAANLWIAAAISMAIGAGLWEMAFITAIVTALVLAANNCYKSKLYTSMQNKNAKAEGANPGNEYIDLENLTGHIGSLAIVESDNNEISGRQERKNSAQPDGGYLQMATLTSTVRDLLRLDMENASVPDVKRSPSGNTTNTTSTDQPDKTYHGKDV